MKVLQPTECRFGRIHCPIRDRDKHWEFASCTQRTCQSEQFKWCQAPGAATSEGARKPDLQRDTDPGPIHLVSKRTEAVSHGN